MKIREVTYLAVALRVFASVIIGGIIGLEREMKNRAAGLRTYILVCVGACMIMLTNQYIYQVFGAGDPARMGAQVVSGIGFLGAGTIIVTRRNQIRGLTTAAGMWATAGIGLALGIGFYEAALTGAFAIFIVITLMQKMDDRMRRKTNRLDVFLEINRAYSLGDFLRHAREIGIYATNFQKERNSDTQSEVWTYTMTLKTAKRRNHAKIVEDILKIPGVEYLEEI